MGGLGAPGRGWGRGPPYLDLFGVKGHDEAKEEEGGDADDTFNQEQIERPLLGGIEKRVRPSTFLPISLPFTIPNFLVSFLPNL